MEDTRHKIPNLGFVMVHQMHSKWNWDQQIPNTPNNNRRTDGRSPLLSLFPPFHSHPFHFQWKTRCVLLHFPVFPLVSILQSGLTSTNERRRIGILLHPTQDDTKQTDRTDKISEMKRNGETRKERGMREIGNVWQKPFFQSIERRIKFPTH